MKFASSLLLALVGFSSLAQAASVSPVWSGKSFDDAQQVCQQEGGAVVGRSMETTTADKHEFYITACARPSDDGSVYTVAWSAINFENVRERCGTQSVTTGLDAGLPVGEPIYVHTTNETDLFIVICQK